MRTREKKVKKFEKDLEMRTREKKN